MWYVFCAVRVSCAGVCVCCLLNRLVACQSVSHYSSSTRSARTFSNPADVELTSPLAAGRRAGCATKLRYDTLPPSRHRPSPPLSQPVHRHWHRALPLTVCLRLTCSHQLPSIDCLVVA